MDKLLSMNILEIQEALDNNEFSSYDLTLFYLNRIANIDNKEPFYNSVYEVNPDALNIAKALDEERKNGIVRSKMHGIPVLLKDNINTKDKQHTTAGANILKDHFALRDASITNQLRHEGAIILGKTNLTELACFKSFDTVNGYSSLGGYVLCPWDIRKDPSGSSTGSAVSVSLNLAPVSIGTETGGSIMSPSRLNGVVGIKPSIGFVSRRGIVPISSTLDTAGPMGKNVTDVAILLSSIRTNDPEDPVTLTKEDIYLDYTRYLLLDKLKGKRVGIDTRNIERLPQAHQDAFYKIIDILKAKDVEIVDNLNIEHTKFIYHVMKYEFKRNINKYLADEGLNITLKDIVEFNNKYSKENLKYGQYVLHDCLYQTSGRMNEPEYYEAIQERDKATKKMNQIFEEHNLDMIHFASYTPLGPHCGFPTMTIPVGLDENNMPIGTYFLAPMFKEKTLIEIAYNLEQALQVNLNPLKNS